MLLSVGPAVKKRNERVYELYVCRYARRGLDDSRTGLV